MTTETKFAKQGVRQNAIPFNKHQLLLVQGDRIVHFEDGVLTLPIGTIGIVHDDDSGKISIIRDDCQAARRAMRKHNENLQHRLVYVIDLCEKTEPNYVVTTVRTRSEFITITGLIPTSYNEDSRTWRIADPRAPNSLSGIDTAFVSAGCKWLLKPRFDFLTQAEKDYDKF